MTNHQDIIDSIELKSDELFAMRLELAGCSLAKTPGKDNWVDNAGGLPEYICEIARGILKGSSGTKDTSRAIAIAVSRCKVWAAGGGNVDADTRAKAAKAIAEWEKKKASHSKVKASATDDDDAIALSGKHDLIFYEGRSTPEVVPAGGKPKKAGGKAGRIKKRRAATAEEEAQIAKGKWVRVNSNGKKAGEDGYKGGSKIRPQLRNSAVDDLKEALEIALSKQFLSSDWHAPHEGQKCSRWQHGKDKPKAVKCRKSGDSHLGACSEHYKEMKK